MTSQVAIRDRIRELRRVSARELVANPKNWRKHPLSQQNAMRAVLSEIGFADALLAREDENGRLILIDGHLRAEISPDTEMPVLILDVNENEADKILATLDPLAGMAELDMDAFGRLADGIEFDAPEFGELLQELRSPSSQAVEGEDDIPDPPEVPVSKRGDLWLLGPHRVLSGDSTNPEDVKRLLAGHAPNLLVTDPPYGVGYNPEWRNDAMGLAFRATSTAYMEEDKECLWGEAYKLFTGNVAYIWHAAGKSLDVGLMLRELGFEIRAQLIWCKESYAISRGHYNWQHEPCYYTVRRGKTANWKGTNNQSTFWKVNRKDDQPRTGHACQKPVEIMRRPIVNHTDRGDSVYEPFLGSGTTLIAAETIQRVCYGIELDPVFIDIIITRWQNLTGKEATLDGDDRTFSEITGSRRGES
jgi:DNA modification methylase